MTHVTCRLTAKNRDQLRDPTLGNRVWATFTFFTTIVVFGADVRRGANAGARTAAPRLRRPVPSVRPPVFVYRLFLSFDHVTWSPLHSLPCDGRDQPASSPAVLRSRCSRSAFMSRPGRCFLKDFPPRSPNSHLSKTYISTDTNTSTVILLHCVQIEVTPNLKSI